MQLRARENTAPGRILTLETVPEVAEVFRGAVPTAYMWAAFICLKDQSEGPPSVQCKGEPVRAYVNWGRWVADCPHCRSGAMVVSRIDPVFWCVKCGMRGHEWRSVVFPANADDIEALLVMRPEMANRNWRPGETVDGLRGENRTHDVSGVLGVR